ncbi:MAG: AAA family ATPase [Cyanobacteria bacterium]|nr:AAA family ATPase [Cyanobacteriota bacterium]
MRIKEIELDNFKSFGKPTVVPLLDGFTTISGPNGSGKSNIIDSLLFALGLSSTRSMRAERLPDLLNNLSGRKDAKVRVTFLSKDGEELEVTRRIKVKENSYTSTYLFNGKVATLSDIHDRLMQYNVSPTGFNVIMQGDVTGIVTMSATERRRIIDELAGVAEFDRRIDQAQNELQLVTEKIDHQRIVLVEIVARLEVLRADRDQALKYLELKEKKEAIEKDLIFIRAQELDERGRGELLQIEELGKQESDIADKLHMTEVNLLTLRSEMGRIDEEIKEKGGNEQLLLRQELDNQRGELTREENKLSNLLGVIGEREKLKGSVEQQVKAIDKHMGKISREKKQHQEDQKAVQLVLAERQGAYSAVMAEIEVFRQEKDKSSEKLSGLHSDLQQLRDDKHRLEMKKTELGTRRQGINRELDSLRNEATDKIGKSSVLKGQTYGIEKKHENQAALVLGIERNKQQLAAERLSTEEELEEKSQNLDQVNRRMIALETAKEVSGDGGFGRAVDMVLSSGIPGVHGTIGQLGSVDEDFLTALETCIGPRLSHIIVDDDQTAQDCIHFLKRNDGGRATFVPLNKIQASPPGLLPNRPGVIDFAYNLVDFDSRFTKAFQYACGGTIVVETMADARRMLNTARMVTLEGELFEKSGSISGGKDKNAKFHFSKQGETDLAVLRQSSANLTEQIKWLKDSLKELSKSIAEESSRESEAKSALAHRKSEMDNHRQQVADLDKSIEEIKPKLRSKGDEIEKIDEEIASIDDLLKELTSRITKQEESLESLRHRGKHTE